MGKFIDLTGQRFGYWEVLRVASKDANTHTKWICRCLLCNKEYEVAQYSLTSGKSTKCRSCGTSLGKRKEYSGDPIKTVFKGMKQRCYYPNSKSYERYGNRGIKICDEWLDDPKAFYKWAYENGYDKSKNMSIERKNVNEGYSPDNCTFIPLPDQSKNREITHNITIDGKTLCLADWCRELDLNYTTIIARIQKGMDPIEALSTPINHNKGRYQKIRSGGN